VTAHAVGTGATVTEDGGCPVDVLWQSSQALPLAMWLRDCRCVSAVVTTRTGADHGAVIDARHRRPATDAMAAGTGIRALNMPGTLAARAGTVMTARTIATDVGVIEHGSCPIIGVVAVFAAVPLAMWVA